MLPGIEGLQGNLQLGHTSFPLTLSALISQCLTQWLQAIVEDFRRDCFCVKILWHSGIRLCTQQLLQDPDFNLEHCI